MSVLVNLGFNVVIKSEIIEQHLLFSLPFLTYVLIIVLATSWLFIWLNKRKNIVKQIPL